MDDDVLTGKVVTLRPHRPEDEQVLAVIRQTPQVRARWADADPEVDDDTAQFAVIVDGRVAGMIQYYENDDPMYRYAGIDLYLDPAVHGRGIGTDAVRTVAGYLLREKGHHRLVIDPAADNEIAIRCYAKAGFKPVGVLRQYERGLDGKFHDGLLMDLIAEEFIGE